MKFFLMAYIIVIIINVTRANNQLDIYLQYWNINRDLSKASKSTEYVIRKPSIDLFSSLTNWCHKVKIDLKPPKETFSQATNTEQYKKLLMREQLINDIIYKDKDKIKTRVTTRRSLIQTKMFTVRPHDVYRQSVREKYDWNSNSKNINKSRIPIKQSNIGQIIYETVKNESKFASLKKYDKSLHDKEYNLSEKPNSSDSRNTKITLLFPKGNNIKYFKENPEQSVSKQFQIYNFVLENKVPFSVANNSNNSLSEEKENKNISSTASFKSDSKDQMDEVTESENNFFDQDDFIPVRVNDNLFLERDVDDDEITTDSGIQYLVSRPKRSVNIIEEERVAPTLSGIRVTNQDYPISHDLTFKNIHT